jgi:membrane protease YdiL (CAAX protease family)
MPGKWKAIGMKIRKWFSLACLIEGSLLVIALVAGGPDRQSLAGQWHWKMLDALVGVVASIPPLVMMTQLMQSTSSHLASTQRFMNHLVRPLFVPYGLLRIGFISLLAGLGEEALFRGVIQWRLTEVGGLLPGLAIASVVFGLCHWATGLYVLLGTAAGLYLGLLWHWTGNLLTPVVAHALYDFMALIWLTRFHHPPTPEPKAPAGNEHG